jgi:hypothetical protein
MWAPRRLITLWVSTACYRDNFTFTFIVLNRESHDSGTAQRRAGKLLAVWLSAYQNGLYSIYWLSQREFENPVSHWRHDLCSVSWWALSRSKSCPSDGQTLTQSQARQAVCTEVCLFTRNMETTKHVYLKSRRENTGTSRTPLLDAASYTQPAATLNTLVDVDIRGHVIQAT